MASSTVLDTAANKMVGMGQIVLARPPATLSAVLGSCIGVVLYHPRLHVGAMGHVVLPDSNGRTASAAKFADQAVPAMVQELEKQGAHRTGLVARIAGGASMFGTPGPMQVGLANAEAVTRALGAMGIRLSAQDVGGAKGRRASFDPATGVVAVEIVGQPPRTLN
jgi:chemotaxis protein CheD